MQRCACPGPRRSLNPFAALPLAPQGIMYLDDLTFSKVVNGRDDVLVRFDKEYREWRRNAFYWAGALALSSCYASCLHACKQPHARMPSPGMLRHHHAYGTPMRHTPNPHARIPHHAHTATPPCVCSSPPPPTHTAWGSDHASFKELARILGESDVPLIVAGVPISNRDEYLLNPRLAVRGAARRAGPLLPPPAARAASCLHTYGAHCAGLAWTFQCANAHEHIRSYRTHTLLSYTRSGATTCTT